MGKKQMKGKCALCERDGVLLTEHHLTPREMGGASKPTAYLCIPCHKQVHALYTNEELALRLHTVPLLKDDPQLQRYLSWIKKQPPGKLPAVRKSNSRKRR